MEVGLVLEEAGLMSIKPVQNQFNGGEISPLMDGRFDLPAYQYAAEALINNIPISEGCVKRRGGSHFVASAKQIDGLAFKIVPVPTDATVIINGVEQDICYCGYADEVEYTVMSEGYKTKSGRVTLTDDLTMPVTLVSTEVFYTVTINPTPADAKVIINGVITKTFTKGRGSTIKWSVSKDGLVTQSGTFTLSEDVVINVELMARFTIAPNPVDSVVMINGAERKSINVLPGTTVEWSVSHPEFETQSGSEIVNETVIKSISIVEYVNGELLFETSIAGNYSINLYKDIQAKVYIVGGGGAAAMRGVYDDRGYGWGGGSGGAFIGVFELKQGDYNIVVGKANNNTTVQSGNSQTSDSPDKNTYGSKISEVVEVGGGGAATINNVGAGGDNATLYLVPVSTEINTKGNPGTYGVGGKGSSGPGYYYGGTSVYEDYGRGQGGTTGEYASYRSWNDGTDGYVKIVIVGG